MSSGEEKVKRHWRPHFSIRMLLILVSLVAITFARVGYLMRMAQNHTQLADQFIVQICEYRQNPRDAVDYMINCNASKDRAFKWHPSVGARGPFQSNVSQITKGPVNVMWLDRDALDAWEMAVTHMTCPTRRFSKTARRSSGESPRFNLRPDSYMAVFNQSLSDGISVDRRGISHHLIVCSSSPVHAAAGIWSINPLGRLGGQIWFFCFFASSMTKQLLKKPKSQV